ncbi:MAG: SigB/SigF/SigG family RNA polymerase sigma factor [Acidimicrobiales bacterium]
MTDSYRDSGDAPDVVARFRAWRASGDRRERDVLVVEHQSIAQACARRFASRGEPLDDLVQVAMLGLVKAVERFDPEKGIPFAGFAVPTITGELRRHFRDATWAVHVPRRAKDLHVRMPATMERLRTTLGRAPTADELAEELNCTPEDVIDALDAGAAYRSASTDTPEGSHAAAVSQLGVEGGLANEERVLLEQLLLTLPERQRKIVWLRFFEDLSQSEIAEIVGASQVHVSRLLREALRSLQSAAGPRDGGPIDGDGQPDSD